MTATYVIYKEPERDFWMFETVEDGKLTKHYASSKRKAVIAVLRLNPGTVPIILSFQRPERVNEKKVGK